MKRKSHDKLALPLTFSMIIFCAVWGHPQSQALDAQIDGIVIDVNGSVVPNTDITAINVHTGAERNTSANENGVFRFPILTLGKYRVIAEHSGFKRVELDGIMLSAGQTEPVTIRLEPGDPNETVTVTSDAAIADVSKFEIGRVVNSHDVTNLPLISRNPYNFILLQPGVNGRTVSDPLAVNLSANGMRRRVGYLLDGNYDNDSNLSGFRLNLISETFVREVQLLSNGYSAEFGNTAGAVVNVITPSGTNDLDGSVAFLLRPAGLSSKPFGFKPGNASNVGGYGVTAMIGGPILKDRWHFYAGYEWTRRNSSQPITIAEANQNALVAAGLPTSIFVNDRAKSDTLPYLIFRTDAKISDATRVNLRFNRFDANPGLRYNGVGGLATTERSSGFAGYDQSIAAQAVTSFSETFFNEFRFQFARNVTRTVGNELSGTGPTASIIGVANFGPSPNLGAVGPRESIIQFQDGVTKVFNAHAVKIGGAVHFINDRPRNPVFSSYTFASIDKYIAAVAGPDRKTYQQYTETFGNAEIRYRSTFLDFFIQDDWRLTRRLNLAIGLRYDLYKPPAADPDSPLAYSREFKADTNNFGPRLGLAYLLRDGKYRTVVRIGSGIHYDPPLLAMYKRAILNNGDPRYFSFSFSPRDDGAPDFPNKLGVFPLEKVTRDIDAVSSDFETMYAIHSNFQVEQTITENMSLTAGYLYSIARHIPVYSNINCRPVGGSLADGRPIYGTIEVDAVGTATIGGCKSPIIPAFKKIMMAESAGSQNYHALFLQLSKRFSRGFQMTANYTLSRSRDDAPEENGPSPVDQSDPSNRAIDRGNSYGDVTSTLNLSMVAEPSFRAANRLLNAFLNNNQLGLIVLANSGENFNITTGDLNRDGVLGSDTPVGVPRNSGRLPAYLGVDARYSRFFGLREKFGFEFYAEATNVFNSKQVSFYDGTILPSNNAFTSLVNPLTGELRGRLPNFRGMAANRRDSRQVQLGAKIYF